MKARKIKRIFCVVLCLCMILQFTPLNIFAARNSKYAVVKECQHTFDEEYYRGEEDGHYPECDYCTYYDGSVFKEHIDSDNDDWCDVCDYFIEHEHTYDEEYYHGEANGHYPECDYCAYYDESVFVEHISSDNDDWCDVCDYLEEHEHTYDEGWYHGEENGHYPECDYCGFYLESTIEEHNFVGGECICGFRGIVITKQPEDVKASVGEKFSISFKVQGEGLKYQWYYKESYMKEFKESSNKTSAYAYAMQSYMNNRSVYCVITDSYGNQIQTETATIHLGE